MIAILRIGHRPFRDKRISTHVALVARAFGADIIYIDTHDEKIEETIQHVCKNFGGKFQIKTGISPKKIIKEWKGRIVHLTMYGETLSKSIDFLDSKRDVLVIVGAEKVPAEYYDMADINVSVGNQPHSEVAALAVFLDRFTNTAWEQKSFDGKMKIVPSKHGKNVVSNNERNKN